MKKLIATAKQLLHPPEFRIGEPPWSDQWLNALKRLAEPPPPSAGRSAKGHERFLADLATGVWRLRQRMLEPGTARPKEQFRREYRHLESVWDVLLQAGLEIQDHTGDPFDPGQAIKVLARLPVAGINRERVQETIKPSIYYQGRHVQMGEVIVEIPQPTGATDTAVPPSAPECPPPA